MSALATRALDHHTWKDHYKPGKVTLNGVEVTRFPAQTRLGDPEMSRIALMLASGKTPREEDQRTWLSGVVASREMFDHIKSSGADWSHLIFLPYLFGTTFLGSCLRPEISYIVPCLHDEPYAHLPLVAEMLRRVKGLMFNSEGERRLAGRLLELDDPGPVVGMGFRRVEGDGAAFRDRTPARGPVVLYAGPRAGVRSRKAAPSPWRRLNPMPTTGPGSSSPSRRPASLRSPSLLNIRPFTRRSISATSGRCA